MYRWECWRCGRFFTPEEVRYLCPSCPVPSALSMVPDYEMAGRGSPLVVDDRSMWRYRALLPLPPAVTPGPLERGYQVGGTALVDAPRLAEASGVHRVWVKDEGRNPTGSLKDRASALVVAAAAGTGRRVVCTASSGNAAAALAGCCAVAGVGCVVFVPTGTAPGKIAQLTAYGARVFAVRGGYEAAVDLSYRAAERFGWVCRSTAYNPLTAEGKKTAALEIAEQLGWRAPTTVVVPTGDGNIVTGLYRGFTDAVRMGWLDQMPRLVAVQSDRAPALYQAWLSGATKVDPAPAESVADGINVAAPQDGFRALRAVRETGGRVLAVPDTAMLASVQRLARMSGVFAEPSGAAALAGLDMLAGRGALGAGDTVVLLSTGNGLKHQPAPDTPDRAVSTIDADVTAIERIWPAGASPEG